MPAKPTNLLFILTMYVAVLGVLALGASYAYSNVTFDTPEGRAEYQREKTILDERIASAREIKESLRRPIPRAEPLGPITAKVANPQGVKVAASAPEKKKLKLPRAALDAMAMDLTSHASVTYAVPDKAGSGGW